MPLDHCSTMTAGHSRIRLIRKSVHLMRKVRLRPSVLMPFTMTQHCLSWTKARREGMNASVSLSYFAFLADGDPSCVAMVRENTTLFIGSQKKDLFSMTGKTLIGFNFPLLCNTAFLRPKIAKWRMNFTQTRVAIAADHACYCAVFGQAI